jgi:hypothetical protein
MKASSWFRILCDVNEEEVDAGDVKHSTPDEPRTPMTIAMYLMENMAAKKGASGR